MSAVWGAEFSHLDVKNDFSHNALASILHVGLLGFESLSSVFFNLNSEEN